STWDHDGHARDLSGTGFVGSREYLSRGTWSARIALIPEIKAAGGRNSRPPRPNRNVAVGPRGSSSLRGPTAIGRDRQSAGTEFHLDHFRCTNGIFESAGGGAAVSSHDHAEAGRSYAGVRLASPGGSVCHYRS